MEAEDSDNCRCRFCNGEDAEETLLFLCYKYNITDDEYTWFNEGYRSYNPVRLQLANMIEENT